jgi:GLPGLI family protein
MYFDKNKSMTKIMKIIISGRDTSSLKKIDEGKNVIYKNFNQHIMLSEENAFREKVIVQDSLNLLTWKISKETKYISKLKCQKAEAFFRGRNYTAWFSTDVPVSHGPWKLHGLPGLILEAYDDKKQVQFQFDALYLTSQPGIKIEPIIATENKKIVTFYTFKKLFQKNLENFVKMSNTDPDLIKQNGKLTIDVKTIEIFSY